MTTRLELAWNEIRTARQYTLRLVEGMPESDWFRMPPAGVSHIGWQLGHLAMAQYRLCLVRLRGERAADSELISGTFLKLIGAGSKPLADASAYPPPAEIRAILDRVYRQCEAEVPQVADAELDAPPLVAHPLFDTRLGSLFWCARHEMMHAGQIGLLRRQLGYDPQW